MGPREGACEAIEVAGFFARGLRPSRRPGLDPGPIPDRLRPSQPFEKGLDRLRLRRAPGMGPGSSPGRPPLSRGQAVFVRIRPLSGQAADTPTSSHARRRGRREGTKAHPARPAGTSQTSRNEMCAYGRRPGRGPLGVTGVSRAAPAASAGATGRDANIPNGPRPNRAPAPAILPGRVFRRPGAAERRTGRRGRRP